jgi:hypothetical protein
MTDFLIVLNSRSVSRLRSPYVVIAEILSGHCAFPYVFFAT